MHTIGCAYMILYLSFVKLGKGRDEGGGALTVVASAQKCLMSNRYFFHYALLGLDCLFSLFVRLLSSGCFVSEDTL